MAQATMLPAASDKKSFELNTLERGWIKQSLANQERALTRARTKEVQGGEIWRLRGEEIELVRGLMVRF